MNKEALVKELQAIHPSYDQILRSSTWDELISQMSEIYVESKDNVLLRSRVVSLAAVAGDVSLLKKAVNDPSVDVRLQVSAGISRLSSDEGLEDEIKALLKDEDHGVRKFAIKAVKSKKFDKELQKLAKDDPQDYIKELAKSKL